VLFRLAYLAVTNGLAMLRLLPTSDRAKDVEILALRHQLAVLQRQLNSQGHPDAGGPWWTAPTGAAVPGATSKDTFHSGDGRAREFCALWQIDAPPRTPYERVAGIVERCGLDFLVITFAERGSQAFDNQGTFMVPALSCETVDSTGAGNAFSGGIIARLSRPGRYDRGRLLDAVALGTVLAGLQVRDFSNTAMRAASSSEIEALHQEVRNSVRWFDPKV
jgi:hypothetical protein